MILRALELAETSGFEPRIVFADTGNEHPITIEYIAEVERHIGLPVERLKADFTAAIKRKRHVIDTKWRREGVPERKIRQAMGEMYPTGNPFLDLCLVKGRFPSRRAQFCTEHLKALLITEHVLMPAARTGMVVSWQGVRAEESTPRAGLPKFQRQEFAWAYRPILHWTVEDVFAIHARHGLQPNPLYSQGMQRVGCMPCVNCRKGELLEIAQRFPDVIDRIREWEQMVCRASKRGISSFFPNTDRTGNDVPDIDAAVEWSKTTRGRKQYDLEALIPTPACSSAFGLCDAEAVL